MVCHHISTDHPLKMENMNSVISNPIPIGILTLALATNSACPDLIHRWAFDEPAGNAIDGATFADSVGGADGAVRGGLNILAVVIPV